MDESEVKILLEKIRYHDSASHEDKQFENSIQLAKFLYQMRSDFVHKALMQNLCDEKYFTAGISVGGKAYMVKFSSSELMRVYEKSFVIFWEKHTIGDLRDQLNKIIRR